jgi:hypothetical protein
MQVQAKRDRKVAGGDPAAQLGTVGEPALELCERGVVIEGRESCDAWRVFDRLPHDRDLMRGRLERHEHFRVSVRRAQLCGRYFLGLRVDENTALAS